MGAGAASKGTASATPDATSRAGCTGSDMTLPLTRRTDTACRRVGEWGFVEDCTDRIISIGRYEFGRARRQPFDAVELPAVNRLQVLQVALRQFLDAGGVVELGPFRAQGRDG